MLLRLRQRRKTTATVKRKRWKGGAKKKRRLMREKEKNRWILMTVRFVQVLKLCLVFEAFNSHPARKL